VKEKKIMKIKNKILVVFFSRKRLSDIKIKIHARDEKIF
jgi:hypothetical protein